AYKAAGKKHLALYAKSEWNEVNTIPGQLVISWNSEKFILTSKKLNHKTYTHETT
ncbi:MAG: hypothetical protein RI981_1215, partial [Bacteroidota bacterium]